MNINSLTSSIPYTIAFRFTSLVAPEKVLSWTPIPGTSCYAVTLAGAERVVLHKEKVNSPSLDISKYVDIQSEDSYLLAIEISEGELDLDLSFNDEEIVKFEQDSKKRISTADWASEVKEEILAQFDSYLTSRNDAMKAVEELVVQESAKEVASFLFYLLRSASTLRWLAQADRANEIVTALVKLGEELAAINVMLGDYSRLSDDIDSSIKFYAQAENLALSGQQLEFLTTEKQSSAFLSQATTIRTCDQLYNWLLAQGYSPLEAKNRSCVSVLCFSHPRCSDQNP